MSKSNFRLYVRQVALFFGFLSFLVTAHAALEDPNAVLAAVRRHLSSGTEKDWSAIQQMIADPTVIALLREPGDRHSVEMRGDVALDYDRAYVELYTCLKLVARQPTRRALQTMLDWYCDSPTISLPGGYPFKDSMLEYVAYQDKTLVDLVVTELSKIDGSQKELSNPLRRQILTNSLLSFCTTDSLRVWRQLTPFPFDENNLDELAKRRQNPDIMQLIFDIYNSSSAGANTDSIRSLRAGLLSAAFDQPYIISDPYGDPISNIRTRPGIPASADSIEQLAGSLLLALNRLGDEMTDAHRHEVESLYRLLSGEAVPTEMMTGYQKDLAPVQMRLRPVGSPIAARSLIDNGDSIDRLSAIMYVVEHAGEFVLDGSPLIKGVLEDPSFLRDLHQIGDSRSHVGATNRVYEKDFMEIDLLLTLLASSNVKAHVSLLSGLVSNQYLLRSELYEFRSRHVVSSYIHLVRSPDDDLYSWIRTLLVDKEKSTLDYYDRVELLIACLDFGNDRFIYLFEDCNGYNFVTVEMIASRRSNWRLVLMLLRAYERGVAFKSTGHSPVVRLLISKSFGGLNVLRASEVTFSPAPIERPPVPNEAATFEAGLRSIARSDSAHISRYDREMIRHLCDSLFNEVGE